jgi:hypothetical protein
VVNSISYDSSGVKHALKITNPKPFESGSSGPAGAAVVQTRRVVLTISMRLCRTMAMKTGSGGSVVLGFYFHVICSCGAAAN